MQPSNRIMIIELNSDYDVDPRKMSHYMNKHPKHNLKYNLNPLDLASLVFEGNSCLDRGS